MTRRQDSANIRIPPPLIYLCFFLIGLGIEHITGPLAPLLSTWPVIGAGGALLIIGLLLDGLAAQRFRRARTALLPWRPASSMVASGIYRWSRNPMYLGMAASYAGMALLLTAAAALLLLPIVIAIIQTQVIAREERYLQAKFGDAYLDYKRQVRRWL